MGWLGGWVVGPWQTGWSLGGPGGLCRVCNSGGSVGCHMLRAMKTFLAIDLRKLYLIYILISLSKLFSISNKHNNSFIIGIIKELSCNFCCPYDQILSDKNARLVINHSFDLYYVKKDALIHKKKKSCIC